MGKFRRLRINILYKEQFDFCRFFLKKKEKYLLSVMVPDLVKVLLLN